jgi:hypothetical protein
MSGVKSRIHRFAGASLFVLALGMAPAAAQYYPAPYGYPPAPPPQAILAPHHADSVVRSLGLTPLGRAVPHGPMFIVPATGQEGTQVQVTLDRRTGRVVQILRVGYGAPRIATLPPGPPPPGYDADDDDAGYFDDEDDLPPRAPRGPYAVYPEARSGPAVITREGVESESLPPPGTGPRVVARDPDITGSVPRGSASGRVDPLVGVPKEFRGQQQRSAAPAQQRTAARPPAATPRAAPLPRPRPADAPQVAQNESTREPATTPAANKPSLPPAAREDAEKFPPVQTLE